MGEAEPLIPLSPLSPDGGDEVMEVRLAQVLEHFGITIVAPRDLIVLAKYEIVVIADDSGSMKLSALPPEERPPPGSDGKNPSRWDELKATLATLIEIGTVFDSNGIDIFFLHRPPLPHVRSMQDARLREAFKKQPTCTTPLTKCLTDVVKMVQQEKPVLLLIATDGVPDGGVGRFVETVEKVIKKELTQADFRFQLMACTGDDSAIGWMGELDMKFPEVDMTDDYYSERGRFMNEYKVKDFNRADWVIKALLGPVSDKFEQYNKLARKRRKEKIDEEEAQSKPRPCCAVQ
eukprot:TRINITY_DN15705_c0_g1_i1.p1 TRINITY_DN15705_c0_g1~~TRINITY_DN15705_c0_g1_i1.p1  ORF type:complete len:322 (+),score=105.31 TRINITY_DN15705_c0_g1_i1:94-966(+)